MRLVKLVGAPMWERRCTSKDLLFSIRITVLVGLWWSAAIVVTLLIKSTVGSRRAGPGEALFPYSFALTSLNNFICGIGAWASAAFLRMRRHSTPPSLNRYEMLKLLSVGLIQGVEIGCMNKSLEFLSMSGRTMLNSMNVLVMMATALCWRLERLGYLRMVAVLLLVSGGFCQGLGAEDDTVASTAMWHEFLRGVILLSTSMILGAQRWALLQFVLQRSSRDSGLGKISKLHLMAFTMPVTATVCLVMAAFFEVGAFHSHHVLKPVLWGNIAGASLGIAILTLSELMLVHLTSAVAVQVLGTIHQIPIVLAGVVFFHDHIHAASLLGFGICILGAMFYVAARQKDRSAQNKEGDYDDDFSDYEEEELVLPELLGVASRDGKVSRTPQHAQGADPFGI